jgi:hypothetical protein
MQDLSACGGKRLSIPRAGNPGKTTTKNPQTTRGLGAKYYSGDFQAIVLIESKPHGGDN